MSGGLPSSCCHIASSCEESVSIPRVHQQQLVLAQVLLVIVRQCRGMRRAHSAHRALVASQWSAQGRWAPYSSCQTQHNTTNVATDPLSHNDKMHHRRKVHEVLRKTFCLHSSQPAAGMRCCFVVFFWRGSPEVKTQRNAQVWNQSEDETDLSWSESLLFYLKDKPYPDTNKDLKDSLDVNALLKS